MKVPIWIDIIGKLGPLCVAVAVYLSNRAQARWNTTITLRAAQVEDQKIVLALLERRLKSFDQVRDLLFLIDRKRALTKEERVGAMQTIAIVESIFELSKPDLAEVFAERLDDLELAYERLSAAMASGDLAARNELTERRNNVVAVASELMHEMVRGYVVRAVPLPTVAAGVGRRVFRLLGRREP